MSETRDASQRVADSGSPLGNKLTLRVEDSGSPLGNKLSQRVADSGSPLGNKLTLRLWRGDGQEDLDPVHKVSLLVLGLAVDAPLPQPGDQSDGVRFAQLQYNAYLSYIAQTPEDGMWLPKWRRN